MQDYESAAMNCYQYNTREKIISILDKYCQLQIAGAAGNTVALDVYMDLSLALQSLPNLQREIVVAYYVVGYKNKDLMQKFHLSHKKIKEQLDTGINNLINYFRRSKNHG